MTTVRSTPDVVELEVDVLTDAERPDLERLIAEQPLVNAVVAARLELAPTLGPGMLGGVILGARTRDTGRLVGAAFNGGNLLPIGGDTDAWLALAEHLSRAGRVCSSIVGPADAVGTMWPVLSSRWGAARAIRQQQPLLVVGRDELSAVAVHPDLRVMHPDDIEEYLPAAAAMFAEELGVSPYATGVGSTYRRRIHSLLAGGRAFGIVDGAGGGRQVAFKADIGALTADTCQLQGVWVRPDLRGRGIGTAALAGVLHHALQLAPTVSLYVNDFNTVARRLYARLGMRPAATLSTVLF